MVDFIRRALTRRKRDHRGISKIEEPNDSLVYVVKFSLGMTASLAAIEIAHLAILRTWNSEVFAAITALIGTVSGIFIGQKG